MCSGGNDARAAASLDGFSVRFAMQHRSSCALSLASHSAFACPCAAAHCGNTADMPLCWSVRLAVGDLVIGLLGIKDVIGQVGNQLELLFLR